MADTMANIITDRITMADIMAITVMVIIMEGGIIGDLITHSLSWCCHRHRRSSCYRLRRSLHRPLPRISPFRSV
jgi:hypothetical protein